MAAADSTRPPPHTPPHLGAPNLAIICVGHDGEERAIEARVWSGRLSPQGPTSVGWHRPLIAPLDDDADAEKRRQRGADRALTQCARMISWYQRSRPSDPDRSELFEEACRLAVTVGELHDGDCDAFRIPTRARSSVAARALTLRPPDLRALSLSLSAWERVSQAGLENRRRIVATTRPIRRPRQHRPEIMAQTASSGPSLP